MNPRLAQLLVRLYPLPWRERYGAEFEALLETGRGGLRTSANVMWSALRERLIPTRGSQMDQNSRSFQFQSWCVRAPWAMFSLAPLLLLAGAYFVACLILWSGWNIFLPGNDTPFVGPLHGLANCYFQADRLCYFSAPVLVGWGFGLIAARQNVRAVWPISGLILMALMGGAAQIQASRTAVPGGLGHVSMTFALGPSVQGIYEGLLHASVILLFTVFPYLLLRFQRRVTSLR